MGLDTTHDCWLDAIVLALERVDAAANAPSFLGHAGSARIFAAGLRTAAEAGENVEFH